MMNSSFAAGIVPYTISNGYTYFLLGKETSNNKWSGFVGGSEPGETPRKTAIREFHEETATIFTNANGYIEKQLTLIEPIIEKTSTGKTVYIWFVEFPAYVDFLQFYINKQILNEKHFKEKSELRWFSFYETQSKNVLYKLKKMILLFFK
uniref:Nudix hydrolase domain-containing protein n=1 Tax=viral metagenome TaxID=1070528 RepID=A0A6C0AZW4_9ZZZZ